MKDQIYTCFNHCLAYAKYLFILLTLIVLSLPCSARFANDTAAAYAKPGGLSRTDVYYLPIPVEREEDRG